MKSWGGYLGGDGGDKGHGTAHVGMVNDTLMLSLLIEIVVSYKHS